MGHEQLDLGSVRRETDFQRKRRYFRLFAVNYIIIRATGRDYHA